MYILKSLAEIGDYENQHIIYIEKNVHLTILLISRSIFMNCIVFNCIMNSGVIL